MKQVEDTPDDGGLDDLDGFDFTGGGDEPDTETRNDWWGLRNAHPPVTPEEIGGQLDHTAEWYQHLACGFIKQSGSEGTEAWMHYVMAVMLLLMEFADVGDAPAGGTDTGDGEMNTENLERDAGELGPDQFEGPIR